MSCSYHKDSDIYEKYLLGQLSEDQKSEFEKHLEGCQNCQEQIQRHQIIIGSLQQIGRAELKAELQKQLKELDDDKVVFNWGMILKAAAVLLFFVLTPGIIYYYQEIMPRQEPKISEIMSIQPEEEVTVDEDLSNGTKAGGQLAKPQLEGRSNEEFKTDDKISLGRGDLPSVTSPKKGKEATGSFYQEIPAERQKAASRKELTEAEAELDRIQGADIASGVERKLREEQSDMEIFPYEKNLQTASPASIAKTEEVLGETGALSRRSSLDTPVWQFSSANQIITVRPVQSKDVYRTDNILPDSFAVNILRQDSTQIDMEWLVPQQMLELNPELIQMGIMNKNQLNVFIDSQLLFRMDLYRDSTYAKQIFSQPK